MIRHGSFDQIRVILDSLPTFCVSLLIFKESASVLMMQSVFSNFPDIDPDTSRL